MNIQDHKLFTDALFKVQFLKDILRIDRVELFDKHLINWDCTIQHKSISLSQRYKLQDINIVLVPKVDNHQNNEVNVLELLFDTTVAQIHTLHVLAIEDTQYHNTQYLIVKDDEEIVPNLTLLADNEEYIDEYTKCYRNLLKLFDIKNSIDVEEEIIITRLADLRIKITQIITHGECDELITVSLKDIGINNQALDELRAALEDEAEELGIQLNEKEMDRLFKDTLTYELGLMCQTVIDIPDVANEQ